MGKKGLPRRPFDFFAKMNLCFGYFAGLQAGGAYANALVATIHLRMDGAQIYIPAATAHVMRVAHFIAKLRAFAADITNLCHFRNSR